MKNLWMSNGKINPAYNPPFGYDMTEEGRLIPIEDDLKLLEEIGELVEAKALSLRDGALWLSANCSRSISHEGLRKRLLKPIRVENESLKD